MPTTSTRVLRLLSLLQAQREWSGADLSERLEVNVRTIRRDAERLRELGYSIDSFSGPGGGYRLGAGTRTPPLLLEDDEALAVALALSAFAGAFRGTTDPSLSALVKLDQLLPARLKRQWQALKSVTLALSGKADAVDPATMTKLASACRDERIVTFTYRDGANRESRREVEAMRLVHTGHRWYLVGWDMLRQAWRTFRLDRIEARPAPTLGGKFSPRQPPEDFASLVSRSLSSAPYRVQARLKLHASLAEARKRVPTWVGHLEPFDARNCILSIGANTMEDLTALVVQTGFEFELLEPEDFASTLRKIAGVLARGAGRKRKLR